MLAFSSNPVVIMLMINLCLLILGCVMDMAPLILITTPIFLPVVTAIGVDPVQFGMIMMMNLGLGLPTAPVGAVIFVGCAIGKIPVERRDPGFPGADHLCARRVADAAALAAGLRRLTGA